MIGGIVLGVLLFMFLVFIHELGHFWAAKKAGVKVLEFGLGIPPKAFTIFHDKSGTEYTINWIPLGGFVRLKGENPQSDDFLDTDSFITASLPWKLVILAAGVVMNFIFAWFIFSSAFVAGVQPITVVPDNLMPGEMQSYLMPTPTFLAENGYLSGSVEEIPAQVLGFLPESIGADAGLLSGDIITQISGSPVLNTTLGTTLKPLAGATFALTIDRDGTSQEIDVTCPEDSCLLGVQIASGGSQEILPIQMGVGDAIGAGLREIIAQSKLTFSVLGTLAKNLSSGDSKKAKKSVDQLSGPVGIVKFGDTILRQGGVWMYLAFGGMISLALALFNILPIPALDGGRALSVILQKILHIPARTYFAYEGYFNFFFFVILMLLGVYIMGMDLEKFWGVNVPGIGE